MRSFIFATGVAVASAYSVTDFEHTVEGLLMGFLQIEVSSAVTCIKDAERVAGEVETAVKDFEKETFSGVSDGIIEIGTIVGEIQQDFQDCQQAVMDAESLAKLLESSQAFTNPWEFAYHVGKDLVVNRVDIYNEINTAIDDWNTSDWYNFGFNVGEALSQVVIGAEYQMDSSQTISLVEGILAGSIELAIPSTTTCFQDIETLGTELQEAITDFKKETFSGVSDGIKEIGTIVGQVQQDLADCQLAEADAEKLAQMADNFKNPWSFAMHVGEDILLNGVDIYHEIGDAVTKYDSGDYYGSGYAIGEALEEVLIGGNGIMGRSYRLKNIFQMMKSSNETCTGPHESCCEAPQRDVHNCPASARTSDCDAVQSCCCG